MPRGTSKALKDQLKDMGVKVVTYDAKAEDGRAKAMEKVTKSDDVRFSVILGDKKDNNGNRFFEKDGTIDLWRLDDLFRKAGREIAPIRLTDKNVNHTLKNHNDFFKNIGDVIEYTDYVLQNANVMRKTTNTSVYVSVEVENDPDKTAILRLYLSDYGDYYNVETVGNRRKGFLNNEKFEIIARRSEPFKNEAASFSARPTPQQSNNGNEESNATDAIISFGKGTTNNLNDQTNSQENSKDLQDTNNESLNANIQDAELPLDEDVRYSVREGAAPKNTKIGYKVFRVGKDGKLYPPMVANPNGEDTPVGVWLNADESPIIGESKTGRPKVKATTSGTLAYRPGWHLGEIPYALQFNKGEKIENPMGVLGKNGKPIKVGKYFPKDLVWAEVEYAADNNYQEEAMQEGMNAAGNFQHSLAGLKRVPTDGYYMYRTNANPATDPWIITGAMKVNRVLSKQEVDDLVRANGREPQEVEPDNTRFSITPQQDQEYMEAVNSGDMEKAGEMVKAAADKAGYNSPMVYHGTVNGSFVTFNTNNQRTNAPDNTYWFTSKRKVAEDYTTDESGSKAQNQKSIQSILQ